MTKTGTLTFFCGKMGAGKSTKSKEFASENNAVLLSEDEWLSILYPQQILSFDAYMQYSARLRPLIKLHVQKILSTGTHVVLDFPANTVKQRAWFKSIAKEIGAHHQLIYLEVSDEHCIKHIAKRRLEQPQRSAFDTEEMFRHVSKYFEIPIESEQLTTLVIGDEKHPKGLKGIDE
ncbi:MAG: ATP-binding protein [Campylobacterales bacterium]|nr:ATP-binding protein [Campylobacterales bacterium]